MKTVTTWTRDAVDFRSLRALFVYPDLPDPFSIIDRIDKFDSCMNWHNSSNEIQNLPIFGNYEGNDESKKKQRNIPRETISYVHYQ